MALGLTVLPSRTYHLPFCSIALLLAVLDLTPVGAQERLFVAGRLPDPPQETNISSGVAPVDTDPSQGVYLVPVAGQEDIQHARQLIANPFGTAGNIFTADIAYADVHTLNRNYIAPGAPAWSWEITKFVGFGDIIAEVYDGNPQLVEEDLQYWVENLGRIGFWDYTIIGEFPLQPLIKVDGYWRYCPWLGYINDIFYPWIYHVEEGWLYVFGFDPKNIWMWSPEVGYFWTNEDIFPETIKAS